MFFSNGLVGTIMVLGLIALFWPMIQDGLARVREAACSGLTRGSPMIMRSSSDTRCHCTGMSPLEYCIPV